MTARTSDTIVSADARIHAPATRVWQALTEPADLIRWYAPGCRWEVPSLQVGATIRFFNTETDVQRATIEECTPPSALALRWTPDPSLPSATLLNRYAVEREGGTTRITITQTGYASVPEEQRAAWISADEGALPAIAAALAAYLEGPGGDSRTATPPRQ